MSTLACETVVKQTTSTPVGVDDALSDDGSEYYDFDPSTFGVNDGIPQGDPSDLMGLSEGMKISSNTDTSNPVPKTKEYQPLSAILQPKENFSRSPLPSLPYEPSEKTDSDVPIPSLQSCISVSNSMSTHPVPDPRIHVLERALQNSKDYTACQQRQASSSIQVHSQSKRKNTPPLLPPGVVPGGVCAPLLSREPIFENEKRQRVEARKKVPRANGRSSHSSKLNRSFPIKTEGIHNFITSSYRDPSANATVAGIEEGIPFGLSPAPVAAPVCAAPAPVPAPAPAPTIPRNPVQAHCLFSPYGPLAPRATPAPPAQKSIPLEERKWCVTQGYNASGGIEIHVTEVLPPERQRPMDRPIVETRTQRVFFSDKPCSPSHAVREAVSKLSHHLA